MTAVIVIEAVVIALLLVLVAGLLKSHAEILRRLDRLDPSGDAEGSSQASRLKTTGMGKAPVTEVVGTDPAGSAVTVSLSHGRGDTILAFLSTGCSSCMGIWKELRDGVFTANIDARPVVVTKGTQAESPAKVAELADGSATVIMSDDAWDAFRVPLTPYFMLVDGQGGILGEGSANDSKHLASLFSQAASDQPQDPTRLGNRERQTFTDRRLSQSGVEPGDPSLYQDPLR